MKSYSQNSMISYSRQRSHQNQHQHRSPVPARPRRQPVQPSSQTTPPSGNPCRTQAHSNARLPRTEESRLFHYRNGRISRVPSPPRRFAHSPMVRLIRLRGTARDSAQQKADSGLRPTNPGDSARFPAILTLSPTTTPVHTNIGPKTTSQRRRETAEFQ